MPEGAAQDMTGRRQSLSSSDGPDASLAKAFSMADPRALPKMPPRVVPIRGSIPADIRPAIASIPTPWDPASPPPLAIPFGWRHHLPVAPHRAFAFRDEVHEARGTDPEMIGRRTELLDRKRRLTLLHP